MQGAAGSGTRTRPPGQEEGRGKEDRQEEDYEEKGKEEGREKEDHEKESFEEEEMIAVSKGVEVLLRGGVIAYPTEGIFGLGCLPDDPPAVQRVIDIKQRDAAKGLILIAADAGQLEGWIDLPADRSLPDPDPGRPVTWIVPPGPKVTPALCGTHATIAVRLTTNPTAKALCEGADAPLVSTSANLSGQPTARNRFVLRRQFGDVVDYIVPGDCGPASGPSEIRDFASGQVLRPHSK
jgi:L-threonylcarbamoyladenylate synthase